MDPLHINYDQSTSTATFQQGQLPPVTTLANMPSLTEPTTYSVTNASNVYPPVASQQSLFNVTNQQHQTAVAVTVLNVEQCSLCSNFYEQQCRPIPQPDLNRMICKLLDVAPSEHTFFREYIAICVNCTNLLRKFDRLRVELEFVKTQVVTYVIESLTQMRPEGGTPIDTLKNQILNRWTNAGSSGKKRKEGFSAADKTSNPSNELSFATLNNIMKNPTVVEPVENWAVGSEVTVRNHKAAAAATATTAPPPSQTVTKQSQPEDLEDQQDDHDYGDYGHASGNDDQSFADEDSNDETEEKEAVANIPKNNNQARRSNPSTSPVKRKNVVKREESATPKRKRKPKPYKPLPNEVAPLICTLCGRIFDRMCNYNAHAQACFGDDAAMEKNCDICTEQMSEPCVFDTWDDFKTHVYSYHPRVKIERCTFCRLRFLPNGVKRHKCLSYKRQVHKDAIFKCDRCDRAYNSRANLTDHVRRIHKDEKHTCETCGKTYGSPMLLNLHVDRHKLVVTKFRCNECGVCLSSSFSLKEHIKRHNGVPQWECEVCGRKFFCKTTFKNHAQVHSNIKPHVCDICGSKFKLKSTLRRHVVRHQVEETNYTKKCPLCPKAIFRKMWVLKRHMEIEHPFTQEREDILEKYKDIDDFPKRKQANVKRYDKAGKGRINVSRVKVEVYESDDANGSENDDWDDNQQTHSEAPSTSTAAPSRKSARLENKGIPSKHLVVILQKDSSLDAQARSSSS